MNLFQDHKRVDCGVTTKLVNSLEIDMTVEKRDGGADFIESERHQTTLHSNENCTFFSIDILTRGRKGKCASLPDHYFLP